MNISNDLMIYGFAISQIAYAVSLMSVGWFMLKPVNWVDVSQADGIPESDLPYIVLFYPVLKELEETMHTTFLALSQIDYPASRYRVVAIPNDDDLETVASLRRLALIFPFLNIVEVPPTSDTSWESVWASWEAHPKAYWWHEGVRARNRKLPPKKTRQLIYAFYKVAEEFHGREDFLVNYIDADSCPPTDHFRAAAAGIRTYDVLQAQNIAGNVNDTMASTWHSFDHMAWDGFLWPHLSANGSQPFWVLGKGLFFKASDLVELGGFHPWITIEDPEVGMRFWANGKKLGVIENPLIEEVPATLAHGITQRKRWVCGFFQSLGTPLSVMGMDWKARLKARMIFLPCMSLSFNAIGLPIGIVALWTGTMPDTILPRWTVGIACLDMTCFALIMGMIYWKTWKRMRPVATPLQRLWFFIRANPLSLMIWWLIWIIPLWLGWRMYKNDGGLVWERTVKINANNDLVRGTIH